MGLNGSVTAGGGMGKYPKLNESFNINYRTGKVNLFGNYSYGYYKNNRTLDLVRKIRDSGTKNLESIYRQRTNEKNKKQTHNFKLGADYFMTKRTTIGFVFNGYVGPNKCSFSFSSVFFVAFVVFLFFSLV